MGVRIKDKVLDSSVFSVLLFTVLLFTFNVSLF